jgi:glycosyltransferase involved in cell wall biosynthesis
VRIVHVAQPSVHPYSGLLTVTVQLSRALARAGHEVGLIALGPWSGARREPLDTAAAGGVAVREVPLHGGRFQLGDTARRALVDLEVDIVHLHGVFTPRNCTVARTLRAPYTLSPHGGYAPESLAYHALRKRVFRRALELPMLQRSRGVFALTSSEREELRSFGVTRPIVVAPNGIEEIPDDHDRTVLRRELGVPPGDRIALYLGRIDLREKRLDEVVRALVRAPDWHLVLLGSDFRGQLAEIHTLSRSLRVDDRVHLPAARRGTELLTAVAGADVVVLMSRSEGMSMAMLDAFAAGAPLLVSPEVERRSRVAAAGAGWLCAPHAVGARLRTLDPQELRAAGAAAAALAPQLAWDVVVGDYERGYEALLAGGVTR